MAGSRASMLQATADSRARWFHSTGCTFSGSITTFESCFKSLMVPLCCMHSAGSISTFQAAGAAAGKAEQLYTPVS
eukprot:1148054-Pelagomonas_calceolata.AAC.4